MVFQLILILGIIIVGAYIFGIGTDFFDDVLTSFEARAAKQAAVPEQSPEDRPINIATERGEGYRVCDLNLTFFATMTDFDATQLIDINLSEERFIWHGAQVRNIFGNIGLSFLESIDVQSLKTLERVTSTIQGPQQTSTQFDDVYDYSWKCEGLIDFFPNDPNADPNKFLPPSEETSVSTGEDEICVTRGDEIICSSLSFFNNLGWNLAKNHADALESASLSLLSFGASETDNEIIIVNFVGQSRTSNINRPSEIPNDLYSPKIPNKGTFDQPFTKVKQLPKGADFPYDYRIDLVLEDVTEDDYLITFWDANYKQNGEAVGHMFEFVVCRPGAPFGIC